MDIAKHPGAEAASEILARIHNLRESRGLSQADLAARAGLSTTQMSRLVNGQRKLTATELGMLADALDVSTSELLGEAEPALGVAARLGNAVRAPSLEGPFKRAEDLLRTRDLLAQVMDRPPVEERPVIAVPTSGLAKNQGPLAAKRLRAALGLGADPIADLEGLAAQFGIDVSTQSLPENLHGLLVVDRRTAGRGAATGVALLNGNDTAGRRRYTLAHEIGHMVFGDAQLAIADYKAGQGEQDQAWTAERLVELRADNFAAHLLAPDEGVREVAAGVAATSTSPAARVGWATRVVVETALRFGTSFRSACFRVDDAGLIEKDTKAALMDLSPYAAFDDAGYGDRKGEVLDATSGVEPPVGLLAQALGAYQDEMLGLKPLASLYDLSTPAQFESLRIQLAEAGWAPTPATSA